MAQNDGGPAFPSEWVDLNSIGESTTRQQYPGASLRDLFAVTASEEDVQRVMNAVNLQRYAAYGNDSTPCTRQEARYLHADAMLRAREMKP